MTTQTTTLIARAQASADAAADAAHVTVRVLSEVADFVKVVDLLQHIWKTDSARPPVNVETLRALSKAGSYVGGAFDGDDLVGACFGFFGAPDSRAFHSHIAGVRQGLRGRNVGFAIKMHQRAWALQNNIDEISWTFDPLVSRNAYFNLVKLRADVSEYLENFYGHMSDELNGSDDTDRLLVTWHIARGDIDDAPPVAASIDAPALLRSDAAGEPVISATDATIVTIGLPSDVEASRAQTPATATAWRLALRQTLGAELRAGARVVGFDRQAHFIVNRRPDPTGEKQ